MNAIVRTVTLNIQNTKTSFLFVEDLKKTAITDGAKIVGVIERNKFHYVRPTIS